MHIYQFEFKEYPPASFIWSIGQYTFRQNYYVGEYKKHRCVLYRNNTTFNNIKYLEIFCNNKLKILRNVISVYGYDIVSAILGYRVESSQNIIPQKSNMIIIHCYKQC